MSPAMVMFVCDDAARQAIFQCLFLPCSVHWSLRPLMLTEGAVPIGRDFPEPVLLLGTPAGDLCPTFLR